MLLLGNMVLLSNVEMVSSAASIRKSSLTALIILRSKLTICSNFSVTIDQIIYRIILASIRDKGICPCPRCLVPKSTIRNLGTTNDRRLRETLLRSDNPKRRSEISSARCIIYEENYMVNSAAVEKILKQESLVPNLVISPSAPKTGNINLCLKECFFGKIAWSRF